MTEKEKSAPHPKTEEELKQILAGIKEIGGPKDGTIKHNDWSVKGRVSDF